MPEGEPYRVRLLIDRVVPRLRGAYNNHPAPPKTVRGLLQFFSDIDERHQASLSYYEVRNKEKADNKQAKATIAGRATVSKERSTLYKPSTTVAVQATPVTSNADKKGPAKTDEQKDEYAKEGRCFRCGAKGHLANKCPEKMTNTATIKVTNVEEIDEFDRSEGKNM